ncbi:2,3-bisphosphoglycerate-independent phosphoglycerate mutase [Methanococcus maripaludis]|uniref:2,3-bisphosphoglycerate-independent phosphoglycerate mutase n=1 Tax=Methanococcus maripaludis TaxID=39152 RepID=A0A7J9P1G4_METMI|nr:2,3-bisphosphoglycerate-independent phosphoglycerate mutase [Methanococcus maripaludis]MBA2853371.1 2,3-bisphosphoglycerate-independent phosphoglycerate mutase [Methanococcus maripaludis]
MRTLLLLLDGLGDRPSEVLKDKTPLEYAKTPNLDAFAKKSVTGMMTPYKKGVPLGTEVAHFLLWGYDLSEFPGRGVIEALGEDIKLKDNSIYLRATFGYVERKNGFFVKDRRTKNISIEEIKQLINSLPKKIGDYEFNLHYSFDTHCILEISSSNYEISDKISDSDPFYRERHVLKVKPLKNISERLEIENAVKTAEVLNKYLLKCSEILENHPVNITRKENNSQLANFLLTKWAGRYRKVDSFQDKWGMNAAIIAKSSVFKGLSKLLKMDYYPEGDFQKAFLKGIELKNYDFVHIHTKEPDEAGHTKNPINKVEVIEKIDKCLQKINELNDKLVIVTADHSTPSVGTLIHSGEDVPLAIFKNGIMRDRVEYFNEKECSKGQLNIKSKELMNLILKYTNKTRPYTTRIGNKLLNYIPKNNSIEHLK